MEPPDGYIAITVQLELSLICLTVSSFSQRWSSKVPDMSSGLALNISAGEALI